MALGPMSTPLRSWPRSMGTPKRPTGSRSLSGKGGTSRTSWVGRRLEAPGRRPPDGVAPAEEHVGGLVAEHALVALQVGRAGAGLVGEKAVFRVEARGEDRLLQRHSEVHHVHYGLQDGRRYARGAGGTEGDQAPFLRGYDGGAHVRDQALSGLESVKALGIQLRLPESVVHGDTGAGNDETGPVAHARGNRDGEALGIDAGEVGGVRGAKG